MLRKKIIGLLLLATGWTACTQNFDEINTDPNRLEKIDPSTLMTPTLYDLANFNYNRAHSFTHHLMQFMVTPVLPAEYIVMRIYRMPEILPGILIISS